MEQLYEDEIDWLALVRYLRKKMWIMIVALIVCAAAGFVYGKFLQTPVYTAYTEMYVLMRDSESDTNVNYADFTNASHLLYDYKILVRGENVTKEVIRRLDLNMSSAALTNQLQVNTADNSRTMQLTVTHSDPKQAALIVNTVYEVAAEQLKELTGTDALKQVHSAQPPSAPSSASARELTVIGGALGLCAAAGFLILVFLLQDIIRTEEDVRRYLGMTTLGVIPISDDLDSSSAAPVKRLKSQSSYRKRKGEKRK